VTRNTPSGRVGSKLGVYNSFFGVGWTAWPIAAGFASETFGLSSPYLGFFIAGSIFAGAIAIFRKSSNHF
jgi:DHA1 family multidrug resistance protein-like MFS transporter/DHA1 family quinolone resistance protein-like MFS transporter